ncbi:MAG: hypothetical protein ACRDQA_16510 [Nocardioidaceae bacterium]
MSHVPEAILLAAFVLASCVWVGGYVAIGVVARTALTTLEPTQRVAFFRSLGRSYLLVGGPALLVALGTGTGLLVGHSWDTTLTVTVVVAAVLVVTLVVAVRQARRMTRLRSGALAAPDDALLTMRVRRGGRSATMLRAAIGLLSLTLVVLGSLLAT